VLFSAPASGKAPPRRLSDYKTRSSRPFTILPSIFLIFLNFSPLPSFFVIADRPPHPFPPLPIPHNGDCDFYFAAHETHYLSVPKVMTTMRRARGGPVGKAASQGVAVRTVRPGRAELCSYAQELGSSRRGWVGLHGPAGQP
jgi:hypothetical protein